MIFRATSQQALTPEGAIVVAETQERTVDPGRKSGAHG
jgi:hypothetical protein